MTKSGLLYNEAKKFYKSYNYSNEKIDLIFSKTYYNKTSLENNETFIGNTLTVIDFFVLKDINHTS